MNIPNFKANEKRWLENLLLDEDREMYANMTNEQKRLVRFAFNYGYLTKEREIKNESFTSI